MTNRRFERYHFRQVIVRMRLGESGRVIANIGLMGRRKISEVRQVSHALRGWLEASCPLPDGDAVLAEHLHRSPPCPQVHPPHVEPYRHQVEQWNREGIAGTTMYQALVHKHSFQGSYSSVRRFLQRLGKSNRVVANVIDFALGDSAQLDFGQGPVIIDVHTSETIKI